MPSAIPGAPAAKHTGMVGRVYRLHDQYWRVVCRWGSPGPFFTFHCPRCARVWSTASPYASCGECYREGQPTAAGHVIRNVVRNVLLERVERADGIGYGPRWCIDQDGRPWRCTGEMTVRPFRGLRRA